MCIKTFQTNPTLAVEAFAAAMVETVKGLQTYQEAAQELEIEVRLRDDEIVALHTRLSMIRDKLADMSFELQAGTFCGMGPTNELQQLVARVEQIIRLTTQRS